MSSRTARVAVIRFPGSNCEAETLLAVERVGLSGSIVRWNTPPEEVARFDAFVLPGGFSYQDRIRAGAVAARLPLCDVVARRAREGAPVFGICNGAQILVEAGIVPGRPDSATERSASEEGRTENDATEHNASEGNTTERGASKDPVRLALAPNRIEARDPYYTRWVYLAPGDAADACLFTRGLREPIPMPMAHGEGRFVTADPDLSRSLASRIVLQYATSDGAPARGFPWNPNGSLQAAAGVTNKTGTVLALMPHPERAQFLAQVPEHLAGPWGERRRAEHSASTLLNEGPGLQLFRNLAAALKDGGGR